MDAGQMTIVVIDVKDQTEEMIGHRDNFTTAYVYFHLEYNSLEIDTNIMSPKNKKIH